MFTVITIPFDRQHFIVPKLNWYRMRYLSTLLLWLFCFMIFPEQVKLKISILLFWVIFWGTLLYLTFHSPKSEIDKIETNLHHSLHRFDDHLPLLKLPRLLLQLMMISWAYSGSSAHIIISISSLYFQLFTTHVRSNISSLFHSGWYKLHLVE